MPRKLLRIEGDNFTGWCCSACEWAMAVPRLESTAAVAVLNHVAEEKFGEHACAGRTTAVTTA